MHMIGSSCPLSRLDLLVLWHILVNQCLGILIRHLIVPILLQQFLELVPVAWLIAAEAVKKPFGLGHAKRVQVCALLVVRFSAHGTVASLDGRTLVFRLWAHGLEGLEYLHGRDLPFRLVVWLFLAVEGTSCLHSTTLVRAVARWRARSGILVTSELGLLFEPLELLVEVFQLLALLSIICAKRLAGYRGEKGTFYRWAI